MNKIKVASIAYVNSGLSPELGWKDIRVDRKSQLGNPYWMEYENQRETVIQMYRRYLWNAIKDSRVNPDAKVRYKEDLFSNFKELEIKIAATYRPCKTIEVVQQLDYIVQQAKQSKIRLLCWCSPAPCHADVIIKCIDWYINNY